MMNVARGTKKVLVGIAGGAVTLIGIVLIPYPGPGWLIVFAGLAILASEFEFAAKVLDFAKDKYDAWVKWLTKQNLFVKIAVLGLTGAVVVVTLWLLNAFGIIVNLFNLPFTQLESPLFK